LQHISFDWTKIKFQWLASVLLYGVLKITENKCCKQFQRVAISRQMKKESKAKQVDETVYFGLRLSPSEADAVRRVQAAQPKLSANYIISEAFKRGIAAINQQFNVPAK
jgi:hypothetical protein